MSKKWIILCALIGGVLVIFGAVALIVIPELFEADEIAEGSKKFAFPGTASFLQLNELEAESAGNDTTGQTAAWLAGAGSVPILMDWFFRQVIRRTPLSSKRLLTLNRFNCLVKKYLAPFHTYLSILALILGILHLFLSTCIGNPFPEAGLILMGILVLTGLIFKIKKIPAKWKKGLHSFHTSWILAGLLVVVLLTGHVLMD